MSGTFGNAGRTIDPTIVAKFGHILHRFIGDAFTYAHLGRELGGLDFKLSVHDELMMVSDIKFLLAVQVWGVFEQVRDLSDIGGGYDTRADLIHELLGNPFLRRWSQDEYANLASATAMIHASSGLSTMQSGHDRCSSQHVATALYI